jgi:hypothetical protein
VTGRSAAVGPDVLWAVTVAITSFPSTFAFDSLWRTSIDLQNGRASYKSAKLHQVGNFQFYGP